MWITTARKAPKYETNREVSCCTTLFQTYRRDFAFFAAVHTSYFTRTKYTINIYLE